MLCNYGYNISIKAKIVNNHILSVDDVIDIEIKQLKVVENFVEDEFEVMKETTLEEERLKCKICKINKKSTILMPCKHLVSCELCSKKLPICPICGIQYSEKFNINYNLQIENNY